MSLFLVTIVHIYIIIIFVILIKLSKINKNRVFFSPISILFLFTILYFFGFYARYFFYYDKYFAFISDNTYEIYSLYLFLFFTIFGIFYLLINPKILIKKIINKLVSFKLSLSLSKFYITSFLAISFALILLILLIFKTGVSPFRNPLEFRIQSGHNFGVLFVIMLYLFSLPLYYSIYLRINNRIKPLTFNIILLLTIIFFFFFGSRMLLLSLIVNSIMIFSIFKFNKKSHLMKKIILLILGLFFIVFYGSYRDVAQNENNIIDVLNFMIDNFDNIVLFYISEPLIRFSQFVHFLWIIEYEKMGVLSMKYGENLLNMFTTYIPRFLYADKPLFLSMEIQKILSGASAIPKTASAYFFAEAYLNLYWFSLLIYPIILAFILKTLAILYKYACTTRNFMFFFIYKDIFWYLYIIYDGLNSISLQLVLILFLLNIATLIIYKKG